MPSTVSDLFNSANIPWLGVVSWGDPVPTKSSGVYVVSMSEDPGSLDGACRDAPLQLEAIGTWLERVPQFELDGQLCPSPHGILSRLQSFWLPDENIVYIGKATSLRQRVRQYYKTPLGDRRPHAGGHWIKTLSTLSLAFVHYGESDSSSQSESEMLQTFVNGVSDDSRKRLRDPKCPFPFANLEFPPGTRKAHGIRNAKRK